MSLDSDQQRGRLHLFESSLTTLFNHVLHPRMGDMLRITQQELAHLVGAVTPARERGPERPASARAGAAGVWGLKVLDIAALRTVVFD
jgi:CRP/FNR family transcriptional regulator, cyclic AMP receptor protein